ncbi:serine hydrolase [Chitinophaga deserti]|uniref:serine hydrolase n=1 Tax=Chitinophaga deserti TaxID=2164099 RepID=UPI001300B738|nr:serine hydrolase [Chitinophaga deserti]
MTHSSKDKYLDSLLEAHATRLGPAFADPSGYRVEIYYTRIDRDARNRPRLTEYHWPEAPSSYFYPASTVKLPAALLALETLNGLGIPRDAVMLTDSLPGISPATLTDTSHPSGKPSAEHYIKKIFMVSDNDAFNRFYELLGQEGFNTALHKKGYPAARIVHRLSMPLPPEANRQTNGARFFLPGAATPLYIQQPRHYKGPVPGTPFVEPEKAGNAHYAGDSLVNAPFDFSMKNRMLLGDLHHILQSIIFPETVTSRQRFRLTEDDYRFLYRYMSKLPTESGPADPKYDTTEFHRNYTKYLMGGADSSVRLPQGLRIFNKSGWAYGFLTDVAYFADFDAKIEFLLSARIYTNSDGIIGDDTYDYETIGKPFLRELGTIIYETELKRERKYKPDFQRYQN